MTTKGNFSKPPSDVLADALAKGYVALHVEQGVPVLDRDLNLFGDLITALIQQIVQRHIGSGVTGATDFQIVPNGLVNNFKISAGTCLVNGFEVVLAADTTYLAQTVPTTASPAPPLPALTTPTSSQPNPRIDTVYVDVWLDEVDEAGDGALSNPLDVGIRTSTRMKVSSVVRVNENSNAPPAAIAGHTFYALGQLSRPTGAASPSTVVDLRTKSLSLPALQGQLSALQTALVPTITAISPAIANAGQSGPVTIQGRNFLVIGPTAPGTLGLPNVTIGNTSAWVDPKASTDTSIVVHLPSSTPVGPQTVSVTNAIGTTTAATTLKVVAPLTTTLASPNSQISPSTAAPGTTIFVQGTFMDASPVTAVTFNTSPAVSSQVATLSPNNYPQGLWPSTAIPVTVPASLAANAKCTVSITLGPPANTTLVTADQVTVSGAAALPAPTLGAVGSQFTPPLQLRGDPITIVGQNFGTTANTQVVFNGTPAVTASLTDMISVTSTAITVKVPAGLVVPAAPNNKCNITVTVAGQSVPSNDFLTVP